MYPALVLSAFKPADVLKGKLTGTAHGGWMRRGLIIIQFVAAIALTISTYVVYQQIRFLQTENLGFNLDEVLIVKAPLKKDSLYANTLKSFKAAVLRNRAVVGFTAVREAPGAPIIEYINGIKRLGAPDTEINQYQSISVDEGFADVFDLKLIAGRMYTDADPDNFSLVIINEKASKLLGFKSPEDALQQKIAWDVSDTLSIVGVLEDYHHATLKFPISPILFPLDPAYGSFYPIRLQSGDPSNVLSDLESLFSEHFPGNPFNAYFLDDYYEQQYKSDIRFGTVVGIFSLIAIVVTVLGLFGLLSYTVLLRTKEIGIRKVLGASNGSIVRLLGADYTRLILIAMLIAIPGAAYAMNDWLGGFANRISLTPWLFVMPCAIVMVIAWVVIGVHVLRAASVNPVDVIKHE